MFLLRKIFPFLPRSRYPVLPTDITLIGERVILRPGDAGDWKNWRNLREQSRKFLQPWEPIWPANAMTYSYYTGLLRSQWRQWRQGKSYHFSIFIQNQRGKPRTLIGGIALNSIERGIAQKGTIGYWLGEPYTGQGYMRESLELVLTFAFTRLRLHRVEASCLPHNEASKHLLARVGFDHEGYAKSYLQINGVWEDHLLWGKTRD